MQTNLRINLDSTKKNKAEICLFLQKKIALAVFFLALI